MTKPLCAGYQLSNIVGITEVPKHWEEKEIKYCLRDGSEGIKIGPFGSALKSEMLVDSGYKVYGQENLIRNSFEIGNRFITEERFQELAAYEIKPGDVLISMMGTIGKCKVVPKGIQRGIMDSHLIRLSFNESVVLSEFVALLIQEAFYIDTQLRLNSKGSIMSGLNSSIIKNLKLLLPTIEEQKLILEYINTKTKQLDELILKKDYLVKLLEEKSQSIITEAVTKGLNPNIKMKNSDVEWIGEIPEHWVINKLKRIVDILTCGYASTPTYVDKEEGIPFLSAQNVSKSGKLVLNKYNYISHELHSSLIKNKKPLKGDILQVRVGAGIGQTCIIDVDFEFSIYVSLTHIRPSKFIHNRFLKYLLSSKKFNEYANIQTLQAGGVGNLNVSDLEKSKLPYPNLQEQIEISDYLDQKLAEIEEVIDELKNQIQKLKEYRQSLINEAVTGQINVHEFEVVS